jgi:hypothetical protein
LSCERGCSWIDAEGARQTLGGLQLVTIPRQCDETTTHGRKHNHRAWRTFSRLIRVVLNRSATASSFAPLKPIVLKSSLWLGGQAEGACQMLEVPQCCHMRVARTVLTLGKPQPARPLPTGCVPHSGTSKALWDAKHGGECACSRCGVGNVDLLESGQARICFDRHSLLLRPFCAD